MSTRLTIGAASLGPGWRILLDGLGVAYERIARWENISPASHSALLVNAPLDRTSLAAVEGYLRDGGAVLDTGHFLPRVDRGSFSGRRIRSIAPDPNDTVFSTVGILDIHDTVPAHRRGNHLSGIAHLAPHDGGSVAYLPFDADRLLIESGAARTAFRTASGRFPNEIVARRSRGAIRRAFERALRWLHFERGLPYAHRWNFPGDSEALFCYRIDSDYGTRRQIRELYDAAREHAMRLTWFLHVEAHHDWLDIFGGFEDQEIAAHGYRHRTFRGEEENHANIAEAASLLGRAGMAPEGFAAPNGFWNPRLQKSIDSLGFLYSSEFSLDYDDLPFHPSVHGIPARALQVPIHPICIGSLLRAKESAGGMKRYFRDVIDMKLQQCEPAILYHHPGHGLFDVMADSFAYIRELGVPNITMGDYARWWTRRSAVRFEARWNGDDLDLSFRSHDPEVRIALHRSDEEYALLDRAGDYDGDALGFRRRIDRGAVIPAEAILARRISVTRLRHSIEDYNARARQ